MKDTQRETESLLEIIRTIEKKSVMLPEFQRDFRWEMEQTYDLFDSLIRDIFIGAIIYGKPSFGMTVREIDKRPRKGKGSRVRLGTTSFTTEEIKTKAQTQNFRIVLDGQQRLTSIYRAIVGIDNVFLILKENITIDDVQQSETLEELFEAIHGEESDTAICIKLSNAYEADLHGVDDEELNGRGYFELKGK